MCVGLDLYVRKLLILCHLGASSFHKLSLAIFCVSRRIVKETFSNLKNEEQARELAKENSRIEKTSKARGLVERTPFMSVF